MDKEITQVVEYVNLQQGSKGVFAPKSFAKINKGISFTHIQIDNVCGPYIKENELTFKPKIGLEC